MAADGTTLEADPRERAALDLMVALRRSGSSYRRIAVLLQCEGYPPRTGRAWDPATVRRLVERSARDESAS